MRQENARWRQQFAEGQPTLLQENFKLLFLFLEALLRAASARFKQCSSAVTVTSIAGDASMWPYLTSKLATTYMDICHMYIYRYIYI